MSKKTTKLGLIRRRRKSAALVLAALLGLLAVVIVQAQVTATQEYAGLLAARGRLDGDLAGARSAGYTDQQLAPVERGEQSVMSGGEPVWIGDRAGFYRQRAAELDQLRAQLTQVKRAALAQLKVGTATLLQRAQNEIAQAESAGVLPADLVDLRAALARAEDLDGAAAGVRDYEKAEGAAESVVDNAQRLSTQEQGDVQAIRAAAAALQAQLSSNPQALRQAGTGAVAAGRNDAAVAAYLRLTSVTRDYDELERYHDRLAAAGADPGALALAAAGAQHYQQAIHAALIAGLPHKVVIVSYAAQELWAYEGGRAVKDTLVTTGRPELPTDLGAMKVLAKNSPWTMHSPWPRTSPYWYPDTKVQMSIWFTSTGEGLHDAYWEYSWQYGPGGQYGGAASHGCIHVPLAAEKFLYAWTEIGTPVIVYPGDGSTVVNQVAQITVDADGTPTTGPKGV